MLHQALLSTAQSAYADLFEITRQQELSRSVGNLSGSFNKKQVRGVTYWYYQYTETGTGKLRQIFVGPDNPRLQELVRVARERPAPAIAASAKAAIALGCASTTAAHFRIIRRLNEIGFFHAGGVLVGTHAFLSMGNSLGVGWGDLARTQDLDFAHAGANVEMALPANLEISTRDAIETLESGFLPVPGFRPGEKTGTFMNRRDRHLRLDFLTPMRGARDKTIEHESLGVPLQPLRFLEFILEDIQQAAVISALGATIVNTPDPARFALHKLLVFSERRQAFPQKALKDLRQAAALLEVLSAFRKDDVLSLWIDLLGRGPGWRRRARSVMAPLRKMLADRDLLDGMAAMLDSPAPRSRARRPTSSRPA